MKDYGQWECSLVQVEQGRSTKHVEALHLRIREHRQELTLAKKDAKRAARALKHAGVRHSMVSRAAILLQAPADTHAHALKL